MTVHDCAGLYISTTDSLVDSVRCLVNLDAGNERIRIGKGGRERGRGGGGGWKRE